MLARGHGQFSAEGFLVLRQPQRFSRHAHFCEDTAFSYSYLSSSKKGPAISVEEAAARHSSVTAAPALTPFLPVVGSHPCPARPCQDSQRPRSRRKSHPLGSAPGQLRAADTTAPGLQIWVRQRCRAGSEPGPGAAHALRRRPHGAGRGQAPQPRRRKRETAAQA